MFSKSDIETCYQYCINDWSKCPFAVWAKSWFCFYVFVAELACFGREPVWQLWLRVGVSSFFLRSYQQIRRFQPVLKELRKG